MHKAKDSDAGQTLEAVGAVPWGKSPHGRETSDAIGARSCRS
jgi:hypothetical protein